MESIGRGTLEGNVSFSLFHLMRLKVGESFMYHVRLSGLYYPKSNIRFGTSVEKFCDEHYSVLCDADEQFGLARGLLFRRKTPISIIQTS